MPPATATYRTPPTTAYFVHCAHGRRPARTRMVRVAFDRVRKAELPDVPGVQFTTKSGCRARIASTYASVPDRWLAHALLLRVRIALRDRVDNRNRQSHSCSLRSHATYNVYAGNASDNIVLSDCVTVRTPGKH